MSMLLLGFRAACVKSLRREPETPELWNMKALALPVLLTLATGTALAQDPPLIEGEGTAATDRYGYSVASGGDVNNDGADDVIVGAPGQPETMGGTLGYVQVFSGVDGSLLYQFGASAAGVEFGACVATVGDADNDGFMDIGVGAPLDDKGVTPNTGSVTVYGGSNGLIKYRLEGSEANEFFGTAITTLNDATGNSFADFVVGSPGADANGVDSGLATLVFGFTGFALGTYEINGSAGFRLGESASLGGVDVVSGDVLAMLGAPGAPNGRIYGFRTSAQNNIQIIQLNGEGSGQGFGTNVDALLDFNGDNVEDIVAGSPFNDEAGADAGKVRILRRSGVLINSFLGSAPGAQFGAAVAAVGDSNNDDTSDLIVGSPGIGVAQVLSGADGSVLRTFSGANQFGRTVAHIGDIDNNGFADVAAGSPIEPNSGGTPAGVAIVEHADPTAEPVLDVDDKSEVLRFYQPGGLFPDPEVRSVLNTGPTPLHWSASIPGGNPWLIINPTSGVVAPGESQEFTVTFDVNGLAKATYTTNVSFLNAADQPATLVKMTLEVGDPLNTALICVDGPGSVQFDHTLGEDPPPDTSFNLVNCGNQTKATNWSASASTITGGDWLVLSATSGSAAAGAPAPELVVSIDPVPTLSPGLHIGTVRVSNDDEVTDFTDIQFTLSVELPIFEVGDLLSGAIDFEGDVEGGSFLAVKGQKLRFEIEVTEGPLKPYVSLVDAVGNELKRWDFKGGKGKVFKKQIKLPDYATYSVVIGGQGTKLGAFRMETSRKMPGKAKPKFYKKLKPKDPLSFVEIKVKALPDTMLNVNATPKKFPVDNATISIIGPSGNTLNTSSSLFVSESTLHLVTVPLPDLGLYRVRIDGLTKKKHSVKVEVAPFQPPPGDDDVSLD